MPAMYSKQLEHALPHRMSPSFETLRTAANTAARNSESLSGAQCSQEEEHLRASLVISFETVQPRFCSGTDYTRAAAAEVFVSPGVVALVSLDSPLAFWPGLRMSIPPLK